MCDPEVTRETVDAWLGKATADLAAARLLLDARDLDPGLAGYHAQQAAEKALKAILVQHGSEVLRTHDLERLRVRVTEVAGEGVATKLPSGPQLGSLTEIGGAGRYPEGEAAVSFDRDEVLAGIELAAVVVALAHDITE
jgi:HEPN domain-containing protein